MPSLLMLLFGLASWVFLTNGGCKSDVHQDFNHGFICYCNGLICICLEISLSWAIFAHLRFPLSSCYCCCLPDWDIARELRYLSCHPRKGWEFDDVSLLAESFQCERLSGSQWRSTSCNWAPYREWHLLQLLPTDHGLEICEFQLNSICCVVLIQSSRNKKLIEYLIVHG